MSVNKVILLRNLGRDPEIRMPHRDALSSIYSDYCVSRQVAWDGQKRPAHAGLSSKKKARASVATSIDEVTMAPGGGTNGGSDEDSGGGDSDGDGDGPRRSSKLIHTNSPPPVPRATITATTQPFSCRPAKIQG